jgi:hypothetical protein
MIYAVEITWEGWSRARGITKAWTEEQAVRNIMFRKLKDRWARPEIAMKADKVLADHLYNIWDVTDYYEGREQPKPKEQQNEKKSDQLDLGLDDSLSARIATKLALVASQPEEEIAVEFGQPIDRLLDLQPQANPDEKGSQHPGFYEQPLEKEVDY